MRVWRLGFGVQMDGVDLVDLVKLVDGVETAKRRYGDGGLVAFEDDAFACVDVV